MKKLTLEEVLPRFIKKHKNRYDYSKFMYVHSKIKGIIICPDHGEFLQTPNNHIKGAGCPVCGLEVTAKCNYKYSLNTLEEILDAFSCKYQNIYDYSEFEYKNYKTKGVIICRDHGKFYMSPKTHLDGKGCKQCGRVSAAKKCMDSIDDVLLGFYLKHKDRYDYSKFIYVHSKIKGIIICKDHGEFLQTPNNHKRGAGCPGCKESRGERAISIFLDSWGIIYERQKKFDDCVSDKDDNYKLSFDFYIPDYNLCIEFDGKQHFDIIPFFGGYVGLIRTKLRDMIKNNYCVINNINLIRIPYTKIKEIDVILKEFLCI